MNKSVAIMWFRRDLRLTDNPALMMAVARHDQIIPVYIDDPEAEAPWQPGAASRWWLHHSLTALQDALAALGAPLIIRKDRSLAALLALARESGARAVYWNHQYEPAIRARDQQLGEALGTAGIDTASGNSALWCEPWTLKTGGGDPYRVFTPYWRKLLTALPPLSIAPAPDRMDRSDTHLDSLPVPALNLLPARPWDQGFYRHWQPGEAGAFAALQRFAEQGLEGYQRRRDLPAVAAVSRLSPHLHFGEIGPQQLRAAVMRAAAAGDALEADTGHFLRELGWREFGHHLLHHFPETPDQPLSERFAAFPWRKPADYAADLQAWQQGTTGFPIVDAGMRQLWRSGWMHNRVRMIVASLLTKNLLIPWQEGARWFWDTLVDADLASNTLGWQWVAGCGADAAPYFRIFNPVLQSQRFDPGGAYIREWLPELEGLPDSAIHAPWQAKPAELAAAKLRLGTDYPLPIVDLARSRARALDAYAAIRNR